MIKRVNNDNKEIIHKFKKKKLNNLMNNAVHEDCINRLEGLLSIKNQWTEKEINDLFLIMYENFDVSSVYGFQLEKALIAAVDKSTSSKLIQVAAMCMSRFANIKQSNGTALIQMMICGLISSGKQLYDILDIPSNLNDTKLSFIEGRTVFPDVISIENDNLFILINRIDFATSTIGFVFDTNYDISFIFPFDDVMKLALSILSEYPNNLINISEQRYIHYLYYVHNSIIRLVRKIIEIKAFRGCMFGYVQSFVEIVNFVVSEGFQSNFLFIKDYLHSLLGLMIQLANLDGIYCLSTMTTLVLPLIKSLISCKDDIQVTLSLKLLCQILQYHHDSGVQKCVKVCSPKIKQLLSILIQNPNDKVCNLIRNKFIKVMQMYIMEDEEVECVKELSDCEIDDDTMEECFPMDSVDVKVDEDCISTHVENVKTLDIVIVEEVNNDNLLLLENNEELMEEVSYKEDILKDDLKLELKEIISDKPLSLEDMLKTFVPY